MCSLSLSARLLPAPASSCQLLGGGGAGHGGKERQTPRGRRGALPLPPLPSSVSLGHLILHPRAPELLLFPLPLLYPPPPRGPGMNPFHRRAAKARGGGMADSDAFSRKAGLCTGCRTGGPRAPRSKINKNFKRVTAECGPKHEPPEQDLRGVGFPPFSRGCSGQTPQRGRLDERGAGGDWPRTLVTALTASGASFCQADPRGWWASPRGPRLLDTRAGTRLWAA